ncbi:MAG: fatty acid cis/trans isomerase [Polyangiaceae bacterium]
MRRSSALLVAGALIAVAAGTCVARTTNGPAPGSLAPAPTYASYATDIQPLLDRRCVVCHACFDAPCQLNLQSFDGADRGASKTLVYHADRTTPIAPSRMFQDAQTTVEWRTRFDFFPVLERSGDPGSNLDASILYRLVRQRRESPTGASFDAVNHHVCPRTLDELGSTLQAEPQIGMPFGLPPLTDEETAKLTSWIRAGSGGPPRPASASEEATAQAAIAKWERFLDADDAKTRTFARYIYEHLVFAHLELEGVPGQWFRLVRSRTTAPAPVDEIATVRPYDDPKVDRVHYRLRRLTETIVVKTHIPYRLDDAKLARLQALFLDADWGPAKIEVPSYAPEVATNPFVAFRAIPARSRYQFLLDDAHYHVKTFIHGPVCKGSVALDVIDEQFLIFFLSPDADLTVTDASFLPKVAQYLAVPAQGGDGIEAVYERFRVRELEYEKAQAALRHDAAKPGLALPDVWDGGGTNLDSVLTVYRHYDSAFVLRGAVGGVPKTAWVLDYPIFERIYYNLVAGFDVFGNVVHQIATRRYMNLLRIEAENGFLALLPVAQRKPVRDQWYRGLGVALLSDVADPFFAGPEPRITYADPSDAKAEVVRRLVGRHPGERDPIQWGDLPIDGDAPRARFERAARAFVNRPAPFVRTFPDAALLRVQALRGEDLVYTLVRNRAHENIDFMFLENEYLEPGEDTLHVVRGVAVSRPNFFFQVSIDDVPSFVADLEGLAPGDGSYAHFVGLYGVRRSDPRFWSTSDFFNDAFARTDARAAGVIDLTRYTSD